MAAMLTTAFLLVPAMGCLSSSPQVLEPACKLPGPEAASDLDRFGVKMIYPTKQGGETWALADDASSDPRFDSQVAISRNPDGSWKMTATQVRMEVFTSTGYSTSAIRTYNRDTLATQGYMQAPNDWKNVEMTGFVKLNQLKDATSISDNFSWYARGGEHSTTQVDPCEGSSLKGGLHYDGRVRFEKESWHVSYDQGPYKTATTSLLGRWIGFKSIIRNVQQDGKTAVKMEIWINDNSDGVSWTQVYDVFDDGTPSGAIYGGDAGHCGGSIGAMPISWGGPIATFRWDNATDVDFKYLSVREIE